jgi:hypothetical protein
MEGRNWREALVAKEKIGSDTHFERGGMVNDLIVRIL